MRDDDEITCSTLPLQIYDWDRYEPIRKNIQREVEIEIMQQYNEIFERLLEAKADPREILKLFVRTERVVLEYTSRGFNQLLPWAAELRLNIERFARILRRRVIRACLRAPKDQYDQHYRPLLQQMNAADPDVMEDYRAACNCIDRGTDLLWNLRGVDPFEYEAQRRRKPRLVR